MRNLNKIDPPQILADNQEAWTAAFAANPDVKANKFRYRHSDIKRALKEEAGSKCIYCESKIGHNAPGDVEHIIPSSKAPEKHYEWCNMALACTECNRRKSNYNDENTPFINPYTDDVESILTHYGPIVSWKPGNPRAEVSIQKLELNKPTRIDLIFRKIEKIEALTDILERKKIADGVLLETINQKLDEMQDKTAEYSGMVISIVSQYS